MQQTKKQEEINKNNAEFWKELCGTGLAKHLGIKDHSQASLNKFDQYLCECGELGMVLADTFTDDFKQHMKQHCFSIFPDGGIRTMSRIVYPSLAKRTAS